MHGVAWGVAFCLVLVPFSDLRRVILAADESGAAAGSLLAVGAARTVVGPAEHKQLVRYQRVVLVIASLAVLAGLRNVVTAVKEYEADDPQAHEPMDRACESSQ